MEFAVVDLGAGHLAPEIETALHRLVQEALTNIARHAQATRVGVVVERRADTLAVIVEDNGRGSYVDLALDSARLGLLGMRERCDAGKVAGYGKLAGRRLQRLRHSSARLPTQLSRWECPIPGSSRSGCAWRAGSSSPGDAR